MTNNTTASGRKVMAITAVIAGLLCITVIPKLAMSAQGVILLNVYKFVEASGNPALMAAPKMVTLWYPFWSVLCMVAGTILILLAGAIYRNDYWARPIALGLLAVPCIAGAGLIGPIVKFATDHMMNAVYMMILGLIPFLIILLWEKSSGKLKVINLVVFLLVGFSAAWNFADFHGGFRILWSFLITDPRYVIYHFALGSPVSFIGVILSMVGIPLLAGRSQKGYWLVVSANALFVVGTGLVALNNLQTLEYWVGAATGLIALILMLSPKIGGQLVDHKPLLSLKPVVSDKESHSLPIV